MLESCQAIQWLHAFINFHEHAVAGESAELVAKGLSLDADCSHMNKYTRMLTVIVFACQI